MSTTTGYPRIWLTSLLAALLGMAITVASTQFVARDLQRDAQQSIQQDIATTKSLVKQRFRAYEQLLHGASALVNSDAALDQELWARYVGQAQGQLTIGVLGFSKLLHQERVGERLETMGEQGRNEYTVAPVSHGQQPTSVVLFEPQQQLQSSALGLNLYAQPVLRAAMARARDTGHSALTSLTTAPGQPDSEPALVLFMPVYQPNRPSLTVSQRRQALRGWLFCSLPPAALLAADTALPTSGAIRIREGHTATDPLIYVSQHSAQSPALSWQNSEMGLGGQHWIIELGYDADSQAITPSLPERLALFGGLLTLLLAGIVARSGLVSQRRRSTLEATSQALERLREHHKELIEHSRDSLLHIDRNGLIQSLNPAAEQLLGHDAATLIGQPLDCLLSPQDSARLLNPTHPGQETLRLETMIRRADGSEFPARVVLTDEPQDAFKWCLLIRDESLSSNAAPQLEEANNLRESILQTAPFAIMSTNADGVICSFNPAAEQLLGYQAQELIGQATPSVFYAPEELRQYAEQLSSSATQSSTAGLASLFGQMGSDSTERREWTYLRKTGERIPVDVTVKPLTGPDGDINGYLLIAFDISVPKRTQAYVQHVAHHDALTGLPNRVLLEDRLQQAVEQARRTGDRVAVMMVDLDHFKRINDSLGHHIGDEMLLAVSKRLQEVVTKVDTVARLGGDEFVVILSNVRNTSEIDRVCGQIIEQLARPMRLGGHELTITPSIGVSTFPQDGKETASLLKQADTAMYQAKDAGRGAYRHFEPGMLLKNQHKLETESALRRALEKREFSVLLQPQVCMESEKLLGCEALLRWHHPQLGDVSPTTFIPLAEEMGLIESIGQWVLREACRQTVIAQRRLGNPELTIAVNVSPRQFFTQDLIATVESALAESGLKPGCLEVEITEGVLVEDADKTIKMLGRLRNMGVRVSIDDFGTGYSSLSYITQFPIDKLKIDQSFIRDLCHDTNDAAVTSAIIVMAHALNLKVVAEGVETAEHVAFLRARGCDIAQGYHYSKPQELNQFLHWAEQLKLAHETVSETLGRLHG